MGPQPPQQIPFYLQRIPKHHPRPDFTMGSLFEQPRNAGTLFLGGTKVSGQDIREANVLATQAIANVVKSSFGPSGLDKMMVDDIGDVTVTNDGATILSLLDVEHPAGKILVDLAQQQDKEVGDGTTSVVIIAAELLRRANELMKNRIHPTTIITGYRLALREAFHREGSYGCTEMQEGGPAQNCQGDWCYTHQLPLFSEDPTITNLTRWKDPYTTRFALSSELSRVVALSQVAVLLRLLFTFTWRSLQEQSAQGSNLPSANSPRPFLSFQKPLLSTLLRTPQSLLHNSVPDMPFLSESKMEMPMRTRRPSPRRRTTRITDWT